MERSGEARSARGVRGAAAVFVATGAYAGYSPFAPGTVGTLWGVALAWAVSGLSPLAWGGVVALAVVAAVALAGEARRHLGGKDPSMIVCDEAAGFAVASFMVPFTATNAILVFILFRIFDILKPPPVRTIERALEGGPGIVLDDVAAGVLANVAAQLITRFVL